MTEKSMIGIAYNMVSKSKEAIPFSVIWEQVAFELELSAEEKADKISNFYTSLMLDGRFHTPGDNTWGLRAKFTYEQVNADIDFSRDDLADDELEEELESEEEEIEDDEEMEEDILDEDKLGEDDLDIEEKIYPADEEEF